MKIRINTTMLCFIHIGQIFLCTPLLLSFVHSGTTSAGTYGLIAGFSPHLAFFFPPTFPAALFFGAVFLTTFVSQGMHGSSFSSKMR